MEKQGTSVGNQRNPTLAHMIHTKVVVREQCNKFRTKEEGQCSCALFANQNITGIESLLSKEIPLSITCGTEGQAICNSTCVSLVQAAKDKGPIILCGTLMGHIVGLKPFVFAKACATGKWVYTGLAGKKPICCHEGKPFPCA
uniref:Uncharacterized protein n=2 Tax=Timema TaxID=61471 RepID=A0A7R9AU80_TIMSH|nr:unnamed protein product [Timema shepardi]CAD7571621.1 unnamed protein product [Timema californicum]